MPLQDVEQNIFPEGFITLPWAVDPATSWIDYNCWIEVLLDSGMALHKILPQQAFDIDQLSSIDCQSNVADSFTNDIGGVNYASVSTGQDFIQRMSTSTYRFLLRGEGMRIGYQIPIPGIVSVAGVPAIPDGEGMAFNKIAGNLPGGIPVWYAAWDLPYMITGPLQSIGLVGVQQAVPIPFNPAEHIRSDAELPLSVVLPWTQLDDNAVIGQ